MPNEDDVGVERMVRDRGMGPVEWLGRVSSRVPQPFWKSAKRTATPVRKPVTRAEDPKAAITAQECIETGAREAPWGKQSSPSAVQCRRMDRLSVRPTVRFGTPVLR